MPRKGRELEELVRDLEEILADAPVQVKSPDYMIGRMTGTRREVDVSVRAKVGTVSVLAIIECRKRKHRQDSTWVEQLATKMEDVGASRAVAVSSEPFAAGAVSLAAAKNIELRTFSEIDAPFLLGWVLPLLNNNRDFNVEWTDLQIKLRKQSGSQPRPPVSEAGLESEPKTWQYEVRVDVAQFGLPDGSKWSLSDVFFKDILIKAALGIPADQSEWRTNACRDFSGPVYYTVDTPYGTAEIFQISAELIFKLEPAPVKLGRTYVYIGEDGLLSHSATAVANHGGVVVEYGIHAPGNGPGAFVTVRRTDSDKDRMLTIGFAQPNQPSSAGMSNSNEIRRGRLTIRRC
jgi:hypothetical protein